MLRGHGNGSSDCRGEWNDVGGGGGDGDGGSKDKVLGMRLNRK